MRNWTSVKIIIMVGRGGGGGGEKGCKRANGDAKYLKTCIPWINMCIVMFCNC